MTPIACFLWGFVGGLLLLTSELYTSTAGGRVWPRHCRRRHFWLVHVSVALAGGTVAAIFSVHTPYLAVYLGLTTPTLLAHLRRLSMPPGEM